ncbi:MAG: photosystem reaction center subunit H [Firmicutes bacterium]|nr:photosystem reaction center subunit H [Bacillota bacterium]
MKKTKDILELPLISISDGLEIGQVKELVINPERGTVDYLLISGERWYEGPKVLPFDAVLGIGEDAVTTENTEQVKTLTEQNGASILLARGVRVIGTRVMTRKGRFIGKISEFMIDEDTGKITACELMPSNGEGIDIIPADRVVTFGRDVLVISEESANTPNPDRMTSGKPVIASSAVFENEAVQTSQVQAEPINRQLTAAELFEERQRQYIMGKKVSRTITAESGEVIAREGEVISEELINRAKAAGKFTELTMNTEG